MSEKNALMIALIDKYVDAWNESELDKKRMLPSEIWSKYGEYLDREQI